MEDRLNRTLEIPRLAREEYARLDPKMRTLVDGFTAGINYWMEKHPDAPRRLLTRMEPWYPLAFIRYNYYQTGFVFASGLRRQDMVLAGERSTVNGQQHLVSQTVWDDRELRHATGSNGWVVNPSPSASGHALLFINLRSPGVAESERNLLRISGQLAPRQETRLVRAEDTEAARAQAIPGYQRLNCAPAADVTTVNIAYAGPLAGTKRRYGVAGGRYITVVELGSRSAPRPFTSSARERTWEQVLDDPRSARRITPRFFIWWATLLIKVSCVQLVAA